MGRLERFILESSVRSGCAILTNSAPGVICSRSTCSLKGKNDVPDFDFLCLFAVRPAAHHSGKFGGTGETKTGIAPGDVTSIWSGNGVSHPNDFGHRVYAQVILGLLELEE